MGVPKRLTEMQVRFAEIIVFGGPDGPVSGREAATIAVNLFGTPIVDNLR